MDVTVLGPVALRSGSGEALPVAGARLRALLLLLALDAGKVVRAERLIDGVWGGDPPAAAGNALQALVSRLRRAAPGLEIEAAGNGYRLAIDPDRVDALRFLRLARDDPAEARKLWRGELDFPEAARADAVRLNNVRLEVLKATSGDVAELEALAAAHPLDESLSALLMRALRDSGNAGRALEVYAGVRARLADRLGVDPSAELTALHRELLRDDGRVRPGNLPAAVSSFIGRESDVRDVRELLAAHRLVTLTGPGGSGKTRLSIEAGATINQEAGAAISKQAGATISKQAGATISKEVWRVELASVSDPAEVPQAIVTAMRLRGQVFVARPGVKEPTPLQRLREALAGRELLLIVDNCEHLIAAAAEVADELLRAAPGLRLLATSREPLGISGERLYPVGPLAAPPAGAGAETAARFDAVRLLLDRAPGLTLTEDTAEPVVRVCRALDGMPLAIELAAARLRTVPVSVVADRLADRFRLLTGGSRTALPRHRTLRAVVDWSWDLLADPERRLWRRFAMFHGGADVTGAEQVCDADLDLLGALVDKSLLVLGADGRYRMLETLREYGRERLAEAGETEAQRRALTDHLLALGTEAEPRLRTADQLVWLDRLEAEHDNLHFVTRAAIDAGERATAARLIMSLGWYWWLRGHRAEASVFAAEVTRMPGEADRGDLSLVHAFAAINGLEGGLSIGEVEWHFRQSKEQAQGAHGTHPVLRLIGPLAAIFDAQGKPISFDRVEPLFTDPDPWLRAVSKMIVAHLRINFGERGGTAEAEMRESLAGFRSIGERWGIGFALSALADIAASRGDFARAVAWQREALTLVRQVGIPDDVPQLEAKLAYQLWLAGERDEAHRLLKQSWVAAEALGLPEVVGSVRYFQTMVAWHEGDLAAARDAVEGNRLIMETPAAVPQFRAQTSMLLGLITAAEGDLAGARDHHDRAVRFGVDSRDSPVIGTTLIGMADLAVREDDPVRAARLLAVADSVRGARDHTVAVAVDVERAARAALGDAGYDHAYGKGLGVTVDGVLAAVDLGNDPVRSC